MYTPIEGWVSKLTQKTAWVRLNYTLNQHDEEQLTLKSKLFIMNELQRQGRHGESSTVEQDWEVSRFKYAVPATKEGRNTVLIYLKKTTK